MNTARQATCRAIKGRDFSQENSGRVFGRPPCSRGGETGIVLIEWPSLVWMAIDETKRAAHFGIGLTYSSVPAWPCVWRFACEAWRAAVLRTAFHSIFVSAALSECR